MNSLDEAIQISGGLSLLAELIGVSSARLGNWRVRGVPVEYCVAIEKATGGVVTRKDLRPDDWEKIWPELATPTAQCISPDRRCRTPPNRDRIMTAATEQPVLHERRATDPK